MKYIFLLATFFSLTTLSAQNTEPAYKRFPTVPPFELLATDSVSKLSKNQLKKNQPVLIMYFSPDCDHCQHQTEDILANIDKLKDVQIVMCSYQPMETIRAFKEKYKLAQYPNIMIGRDTKYFVPSFYGVNSLPYLAFYDKKGNLIKVNEGNVKPAALINNFKEK
ncbi:peroxiredoxin [Parasegetibacter sp. NRK P23]|uniref:peroxiredoxin family protein n=1 Tax=Parasegetibacter sp. NRK P23 TaxID=2942999 RepID=UPI002042FC1E|nr:redoxin domain-containing protein [Parasegetibacter sp. NRK P23]MCM5529141.1 redoxin domain-containing protein [Parasegetibacter sp. NRK P23]